MGRHPIAELYRAEREKGFTYSEIAKKYGVTKQAVAQACGRWTPERFRAYSEKAVVYPNLRRWLNENKVSRAEFSRRIGMAHNYGATTVGNWFRGNGNPRKGDIDKFLAVTRLTYEELFSPVEAETARWEKVEVGDCYSYACSYCGADMRGDGDG